jgi:hypothetical protein
VNPAAALDDDRAFLTDGRRYLNVRQAAIYCGYDVAPVGTRHRDDPGLRRFYAWASTRGLHTQPGRAVYLRSDLDAAITRQPAATAAVDQARQLARQDAAAFRRPRALPRPR